MRLENKSDIYRGACVMSVLALRSFAIGIAKHCGDAAQLQDRGYIITVPKLQ